MTDIRSDDGPAAASRNDPAAEAAARLGDAHGSVVGRAVTIAKPVAEVYRFFRDFSNLPHFMENVVSIHALP